jgi:hypothetical protein
MADWSRTAAASPNTDAKTAAPPAHQRQSTDIETHPYPPHIAPRSPGSSASRIPSPGKLNASTVSVIAAPGNSTSHHGGTSPEFSASVGTPTQHPRAIRLEVLPSSPNSVNFR